MTKLSTFCSYEVASNDSQKRLKFRFIISVYNRVRDEVTRIKERQKLKNDRINLKFGMWAYFSTTTTIPKSEVPTLPRKREKSCQKISSEIWVPAKIYLLAALA